MKKKVTNTNKDPGHQDELFKPKIISRSSKVNLGGTNVYDRLYTAGRKQEIKKKKKIAKELARKVSSVEIREYVS